MKSCKPFYRVTKLPLYDGIELHLVVANTLLEGVTYLDKRCPLDGKSLSTNNDMEHMVAFFVWTDDLKGYLVFSRARPVTVNVITHEVFHAMMRFMHFLEEEFSLDHQEPFAYLCGWINEWVFEQIIAEHKSRRASTKALSV